MDCIEILYAYLYSLCLKNVISYKNQRILDITEPNCFIFQITKLRLIKINEFPRIILPVSERKSNYQVVHTLKDFPSSSDGKESTCNARDLGSIPGLGRSPGKGLAIHSNILPAQSHGQRSLAVYSPCGRKVSDMTERLSLYFRHFKKYFVKYFYR